MHTPLYTQLRFTCCGVSAGAVFIAVLLSVFPHFVAVAGLSSGDVSPHPWSSVELQSLSAHDRVNAFRLSAAAG